MRCHESQDRKFTNHQQYHSCWSRVLAASWSLLHDDTGSHSMWSASYKNMRSTWVMGWADCLYYTWSTSGRCLSNDDSRPGRLDRTCQLVITAQLFRWFFSKRYNTVGCESAILMQPRRIVTAGSLWCNIEQAYPCIFIIFCSLWLMNSFIDINNSHNLFKVILQKLIIVL